jgi:putative CocE/NonD family hydrolase
MTLPAPSLDRRRWLSFMAAALFLTLFPPGTAPTPAQAPAPGKYYAERFKVRPSRGQLVAMRDKVRLSVDIYRPAVSGRSPALLIHTPYSNNAEGLVRRAQWFAKRGYAVVLSDARGRYDSQGTWDPFDRRHKTDGYDLVEWIARQSWCTGKVGMLGSSYSGWTQWWTATQAPPALRAIVPEVAPPDQFENCPYQNGVLVSWAMDWAATMAGRTNQVVANGPYGGFLKTRAHDLMQLPYVGLNERRGALDSPWFDTWIRSNLSSGDYWRGISYQGQEHYAKVTVPSLNVSGWFDANYPGTPINYAGMKKYGATEAARRPRLVIGPWAHGFNQGRKLAGIDYGAGAVLDWDGYVCRWFDHFLLGVDNGVADDPPVHVFVMGRNRWYAEKDWPLPQTRWTKFYLHSRGGANSLQGDGTLSATAPGKEPCDRYTYNPAHPTRSPFTGGHVDGAVDTRKSAGGKEVLVYTTSALTEEVEVTGPVEAKLYAATSARDTDWMVRLVDVQPDGYAALLCDGVLRARCRDPKNGGGFSSRRLSAITPGEVYEYTIRFWRATGNLFRKGHRIRVEISSSYYPYYLRNLNTGADNVGLETKTVVARQKIYHDGERPSHIVLPMVPARK